MNGMRLARQAGVAAMATALAAACIGCRSGMGGREDLPPLRLDASAPYVEPPPSSTPANPRPERAPEPTSPARTESPEIVPSGGGAAYRLRPGDMVVIMLRAVQSEQIETTVDENGDIKLPFIGAVRAAGCTASELENRIQSRYIDGKIYRYLTVHVHVPTRSYFVRGEVRNPGRFPLAGSVTVLQAIAAAGGYTDFADISDIRLTRGDRTFRLNGRDIERNPEKDIEVEAGDTIVVKRSWY